MITVSKQPFHWQENKAVKWQYRSPAIEPRQLFQVELPIIKQSNPEAMTFWISAPETFKISAGGMLLWSGARMYMTWQVPELQVMSDVHRCYCGASLCQVLLLWGSPWCGSFFAWILGESEKGCLHTLLTLFDQSKKIPLSIDDQSH